MDQLASDRSRAREFPQRMAGALDTGVILLNSKGEITWMDNRLRMRLNGGTEHFAASLRPLNTSNSISCHLSSHEVIINGEAATVCVIHENEPRQDEPGDELVAAIEAAMADTSWFTRTIIEKLKALRYTKRLTPRTSDLEALTDREREVLGLICEGRSDAEMSAQLKLSQNTVRNHIAALYRKIGVNRRSAAIIWARERGITPEDALPLKRRTLPDHGRNN